MIIQSSLPESYNNLITTLKTLTLETLTWDYVREDLVMILISSLPESYNNLITTLEILTLETLTWDYVRDRVVSEFERRNGETQCLTKFDDAFYVGNTDNNSRSLQGSGQDRMYNPTRSNNIRGKGRERT